MTKHVSKTGWYDPGDRVTLPVNICFLKVSTDFEQTKYLLKRTTNSSEIHELLNLHILPPRNMNCTKSNISPGTFNLRSYVNEHYDANCELEGSSCESIRLFFTGRTRRIIFWNVLTLFSLRRSWCYSSWRSKLSRSLSLLLLHLEFKFF